MNKRTSLPIIVGAVLLAITVTVALCVTTYPLSFIELFNKIAQDFKPTPTPRVYPTGDRADPVDRSILTHDPCAPPCWYGIVPGETTDDEARTILAELPFVRIHVVDQNGQIIWYSAVTDWGGGSLSVSDANIITVVSYRPEFKLNIKEASSPEGNPDGYTILVGNPHGGEYLGNRVYWLHSGIIAETFEDNAPTADSVIVSVEYSTAPIERPSKEEGFRAWPSP